MVDNNLREEKTRGLVSLVNAFVPPLILLAGFAVQGYLAREGLAPSGWAVQGLSVIWMCGVYNITRQSSSEPYFSTSNFC